MNLRKQILTNNDCYSVGLTIKPKGIMVHDTGAGNPELRRYVGPDDGELGKNQYNNDWNRPGIAKCVHAFIGRLADGTVATYQTLPWTMRGWHAGGDANNTHIGFEICDDSYKDPAYFAAAYKEAVELCAMLCKEHSLTANDIIGHYEGYQRGIASNHGDPKGWFQKYSKSMDTFRADVAAVLAGNKPTPAPSVPSGNPYKEPVTLLSVGSARSDAVRWVQWQLNNVCKVDCGDIDGIYGSKTLYGVRAVQKQAEIAVDGIVGPDTRKALTKSTTPASPAPAKPVNPHNEPTVNIQKGSKSEGVKWVQWELVQAGHSLKPYGIDGSCGDVTVAAIKDFQRAYGLAVDGICGVKTRAKLKEV